MMLQPYLPSIVFKALEEANSILFSFSLVIILAALGMKGYHSTFLCFCGTISYELFLLHGAFLIKYNPIIIRDNTVLLPFSFIIFLLCLSAMSWIARRNIFSAYSTRKL